MTGREKTEQAIDVKQVGRELGVCYVLEGSVRKAAGRVRITAQLIDTLTGAHLWADRFDGSLEDVEPLQTRFPRADLRLASDHLRQRQLLRPSSAGTTFGRADSWPRR